MGPKPVAGEDQTGFSPESVMTRKTALNSNTDTLSQNINLISSCIKKLVVTTVLICVKLYSLGRDIIIFNTKTHTHTRTHTHTYFTFLTAVFSHSTFLLSRSYQEVDKGRQQSWLRSLNVNVIIV